MLNTLAIGMPGPVECIIIAAIGLLIFGKRLPEVGRGLGKGIVEFKKGLKGIDDEIEQVDRQQSQPKLTTTPSASTAGYRFDPHTGKPLNQDETTH